MSAATGQESAMTLDAALMAVRSSALFGEFIALRI